ncbi:YeiH family protein [Nesterenkonia flava]|uniref:Sulfate exporter family transporter n=1 Tax=Nesterenkonia flava TaxID=469799 RepID=A0ABU1FRT3_9MICC|nr:putative sulfate exporter family transporter [Nesterenkonia flava]MDR5711334.1 putative sulfate exporter family transporter [Nesterenkonia flava]
MAARFSAESFRGAARRIMPGAVLALVVAAVAHRFIAAWVPGLSAMLLAVLAGIALRTLGWVPRWAEAGFSWVAKFLLRIGIVVLGLQLAVGDILGLGWEVLVVIGVTSAVTFFGMLLLAPAVRAERTTAILLATGTAICGASAVAAAASVLDRGDGMDRRGQPLQAVTATALAVVTLCGTALLFGLPALAGVLGLGERLTGVLIGASVHEVGQVVAAGGLVGAVALAAATTVKLARVLLLAPLMLGLGLVQGRSEGTGRTTLVPWFVVGFLVAVGLNSLFGVERAAGETLGALTTLLLTVAMVGIGAGVDLRQLRRTGGPALALGLLGSVLAVGTALGMVVLLLS